jgi:type IX secretion system substrate protein
MKRHTRILTLLLILALPCSIGRCQTLSGVVNSYFQITAVNTGANMVTVDNAGTLYAGERVMLYQAKGAAITSTNTAAYGDVSSLNSAGAYELNTICTVSGNNVWFINQMINPYDPAGMAQLITVPSSSSITVSGTITASPWDPATGKGGIVALEATGTIYLNANIDVSGQGFRGGALVNYPIPPYNCSWVVTVSDYFLPLTATGFKTAGEKGEGIAAYIVNEEYGRGKLANGGGGGDNSNSGGAGGGNYGAGGIGGQRAGESSFDCHAQYPGIGGAALAALGYTVSANRIFLGGGGGSGEENNGVGEPGGNGGGIIVLSAGGISGLGGQLLAPGSRPFNPTNGDPYQAEGDGGGGGGAGGTIILNAPVITGAITADVSGARGSDASNFVNDCTGPGGGGGGGTVWSAGGSFPAAVTPAVSGGANGVVSSGNSKAACRGSANGAASGSPGLGQSGYSMPSSGRVCEALASSVLRSFTGARSTEDVLLSWVLDTTATTGKIQNVVIQRSAELAPFNTIATVPAGSDRYTDAAADATATLAYRLAWQNETGAWVYSRIVTIAATRGPDVATIQLFPNPSTDILTVTVSCETTGNANVLVSNAQGQLLRMVPFSLHSGPNTIPIPVNTLASGPYFLILDLAGKRLVKPFLVSKHAN